LRRSLTRGGETGLAAVCDSGCDLKFCDGKAVGVVVPLGEVEEFHLDGEGVEFAGAGAAVAAAVAAAVGVAGDEDGGVFGAGEDVWGWEAVVRWADPGGFFEEGGGADDGLEEVRARPGREGFVGQKLAGIIGVV